MNYGYIKGWKKANVSNSGDNVSEYIFGGVVAFLLVVLLFIPDSFLTLPWLR